MRGGRDNGEIIVLENEYEIVVPLFGAAFLY